nr:lytic transglycosylase domain-containing protein [uncultured Enterobacter sp.]
MTLFKYLPLLVVCGFSELALASSQAWCYTDASGIKRVATSKKNARYTLCSPSAALTPEIQHAAKRMVGLARKAVKYARRAPLATLAREGRVDIIDYINQSAKKYNVDARLIYSVISVESRFDANAVSPRGAVGLMQLMPATAKELAKRDGWYLQDQHLLDPEINISLGARYLSELSAKFDNDIELTLAAYNSGIGNISKYNNKIPPFPETQRYVKEVINIYQNNG